jgi:hypothetical protein
MQSMTETLSERVERLVRANRTPVLSTTPPSVALAELASRIEALEDALLELARNVPAGDDARRRVL